MMNDNVYERTVLIPHETALGGILEENRIVLSKIRNILPAETIIPFYPPHCILDLNVSAKDITGLKKTIEFCQIESPKFEKGFFYRPVTLSGVNADCFPIKLKEHKSDNPKGMLFGYFFNSDVTDEKLIKEINKEIEACNIKPLPLRVFRLHNVKYIENENSDTIHNFEWELSSPHWIKLR